MHIIPVIDIKDSQVVHARAGERDNYRAIKSDLTSGHHPLDIIDAFLSIYPFNTIYIADLDAIEGKSPQSEMLSLVHREFTALNIWLDAGKETKSICTSFSRLSPVYGSESTIYAKLKNHTEYILSLDFLQGRFIGDEKILNDQSIWPEQIIVMNLDSVGMGSGPNQHANEMIRLHPQHDYYLAGGMRDINDVEIARSKGATGVLLATALHNRQISSADLNAFMHK